MSEPMTLAGARAFADGWQADWNSHDLERILAHYAPDVVFRSRKAAALVGAGEVRGIEALRAYWAAALARQPELRFEVTQVYAGHGMIAIAYRNHRGVEALETLRRGPDGRVVEASACHAD
ncbi:nuclear transport factor 2 family protein [Albimonas sp. CAU 1670]|uniref:nuclear transport factor 2 family protein n=1 Tax=Albimonas sp. CAU 1670 TaxID=3032599 RepID=UPI0023DB9658|nr:nuclear transport factor 2 family protein [Albimonas sp. CAU 1670]MDF2231887.1 nuclear transport factor 2 family protein [Albimonas sp. CAU 1670]